MKNGIDQIDKNFEVAADIEDELVFFNCLKWPGRVCGLLVSEEGFVRMPQRVADQINDGVSMLCRNTAGGRLRFRTDSSKIAIRAKMPEIGKMPHFALTGSAGFDLYEENVYRGTFVPPFELTDGYESVLDLPDAKEREITIHFPLYSSVTSLEIGLCPGASLLPPTDYRVELPVVYYGSSITQGGCASRPGNAYENIISRELDCDHVNLGFSGSALGETAMAEYIAGLSMSAFVLDYDHNAPTAAHLQDTHQRMYQIIREKHPFLPVVLVSRPQAHPTRDEYQRRSIVYTTYQNALAAGDENVYFVDGCGMLKLFGGDSGTVDGCHPNDLGFMCMAKAIGAVLAEILR